MTPKTKEKVKKVRELLSSLTDEQRAGMLADAQITTIEGHPLSVNNTVALLLQGCKDPVVGGFNQWIKAGRCVRKGSVGFVIWIPSKKRADDLDESEDPEPARFYPATVFAQAQTDRIIASEESDDQSK
jgi:hypothetical protein